MIWIDWRTLSSYSARATTPLPFNATGNATPTPRNGLAMRDEPLADENRAGSDDPSDRRVRIATGLRDIAIARRRLAIDEHSAAALGDLSQVRRLLDETPARRGGIVSLFLVGSAADRGR